MTKTKIIVLSAGGVVGAAASFVAGYFTGKSMEQKRMLLQTQQIQQERDNGHQHQHAHA
jgi:membrane protein DedA with SNARE-associated domain